MSDQAIVIVAFLGAVVLVFALAVWRDIRVARWSGTDPRGDREARRSAAKQVRSSGEGQG